MSDWPPKPTNSPKTESGQEWKLLEKVLLSSVKEQRRARHWSIFFKILTFLYLFVVLIVGFRGCSTATTSEGTTTPHIAVVKINGTIASDSKSVNSEDTIKALREAFEAKQSKAIALDINSPGGSPVESDHIWQEIRALEKQYPEKKVYAVINDIGASGAYYIASAANEIWVNPSSLVGSIGVIMPNYGISELTHKLGVEDRTLTAGSNKDILSMTKPVNPAQKAHVQAVLDNVHQHFINAVKEGRGKRLKSDDPAIFSGLFWSGDQAIQLGIADKAGSMETLKRTLDLKKTVDYTVERNSLQSILGKMGSEMGQGIAESVTQKLQAENQARIQ